MKICRKCKQSKPLTDFHKRSSAKDGLQSLCKTCNIERVKVWQSENPERHEEDWKRLTGSRNRLVVKARRYNISVESLESLLEEAGGKCQICQQSPDRWVVIDHCHDSLLVRGVLCERCNQALGLFRDDTENLKRAIEYLGKQPISYESYQSVPRQRYK